MSRLYAMLNDLERDAELTYANLTSGDLRGRRVRSAIRSKRRTRTVGIVAASTIAALGVTGTAWAVMTRDNVTPAIPTLSPSPTVSAPSEPSPTATPSPEVELAMPEFAGTVTVNDHLPSALPITPEVWNEAGPGWVLATYREEMLSPDEAGSLTVYNYGPQVAYLISPGGDRYELTTIAGAEGVAVVAWDPLAPTALAFARAEGTGGSWVVLDLVAGTTRPVEQTDVDASTWTSDNVAWEWLNIHGTEPPPDALLSELPQTPSSSLTQDQVSSALSVAQAQVPGTETCKTVVALSTGGLAVGCGGPMTDRGTVVEDSFQYHFIVFLDAQGNDVGAPVSTRISKTTTDFDTATAAGDLTAFGDGVRLSMSDEEITGCPSGVAFATPDGLSLLPGVESLRAVSPDLNVYSDAGAGGSALYTLVTGGCSGYSGPTALVRDEPATGTYTVLIPLPTWWVEGVAHDLYPEDLPWPTESVLGAYVVPDPR